MTATAPPAFADFLLARIAEDEAAARGAAKLYRAIGEHRNVYGEWVPIIPLGGDVREEVERTANFYRERGARNVEVVVFYDPARVLAQCAAYRAIIELLTLPRVAIGGGPGWTPEAAAADQERIATLEEVARALAAIWRDHPDFREEWMS